MSSTQSLPSRLCSQRFRRMLRLGNIQIFADLLREKFDNLAMSRNGCGFLRATVDIDSVIGAFSQEFTTVLLKVAEQFTTLHAVVSASGSRTTSAPRNDSSANSRFACKTIATASFKFARASSSVAPCVFAPGNSSTNAA